MVKRTAVVALGASPQVPAWVPNQHRMLDLHPGTYWRGKQDNVSR